MPPPRGRLARPVSGKKGISSTSWQSATAAKPTDEEPLKRCETAESTTAGRVASLKDEARIAAVELRVIETEKRLRKMEVGRKYALV